MNKHLKPNELDLVSTVLGNNQAHGIINKMEKSELVDSEYACYGYFVGKPDPVFAVAVKSSPSIWLPVFAHESCHVDQYIEKSPLWNTTYRGRDVYEVFGDWLNKRIELSKKNIDSIIRTIVELEHDCETRTLKKMRKYKLNIDYSKFFNDANTVIVSYRQAAIERTWYTSAIEIAEDTRLLTIDEIYKITLA